MKTTDYIPITPDEIDFNIADLNEQELTTIKHFIEETRHVQEIHELFLIFYFNVNNCRNMYTIINDDEIIRNIVPEYFNDYTVINALIINIISSAKTLIESMKSDRELGKHEQEFKKHIENIYDKSFNYRFLIRLRDFAQHGHIPVDLYKNKACFNILKIKNMPHFKHNNNIKKDMENLIEEIWKRFDDEPKLSFTITISEFVVYVIDIYIKYISIIKQEIFTTKNKINKIVNDKPEIINKTKKLENYIIYKDNIDTIDAFNPYANEKQMLTEFEKEANNIFKDEYNAYKKLKNID